MASSQADPGRGPFTAGTADKETDGRRRAPLTVKVVAVAVGVLFAFPALYLVWRNITSDSDPIGLLTSARTLDPLRRSVLLASLVAAGTAILGTSLAWLTTRTDLPGRRVWRILLPLPLAYPTFVGAAAFIRTLNPGGLANDLLQIIGIDRTPELRGLFGAWLALTLFTYPYVYLPVAARLRNLPGSLEESARLLGDTGFTTFRRVVLPQTASAISSGALLVALYTISDFGAVQLMRYDTLTRAIWTTRLADQPTSFALSAILLALAAVVVAAERQGSLRLSARRPVRASTSRPLIAQLGRWRIAALTLVISVVGLALIAPAAALADWGISGLIRDIRGVRSLEISAADIIKPAWNTIWVSVLAAGVAVLVVLPTATLLGRYRSRVGPATANIITSTFAMPGLLIALAMFFWTLRNDWAAEHLRGTLIILVFAYIVRFGAQALGAAHIAIAAVPDQLHDSARVLGAGSLRRLLTVDRPLVTPGLLAGGGLVLLSTMKELPITLLVAPFDFPTLTTKIFQSFEDAFAAEAGLLAMVLVGLSGILTWFLVVRRAEHLD